jgi:hypothetical protein
MTSYLATRQPTPPSLAQRQPAVPAAGHARSHRASTARVLSGEIVEGVTALASEFVRS